MFPSRRPRIRDTKSHVSDLTDVDPSARTPRITFHAVLIPMRLDTHHTLPTGPRLRLRLPHTGDRPALADLLQRLGLTAGDLHVGRALRFDPRTHVIVCATVWHGGAETMAGLVAAPRDAAQPDLLLADEALTPGVGDALVRAMQGAASRRRAA